jgi:hypothetical protein
VRLPLILTLTAVALEVIATLLLLTSPPSNSHLWSPINIGRFGGVILAAILLAITLQAVVGRRISAGRAVALVSLNVLAIAIGVAIAGWETRS